MYRKLILFCFIAMLVSCGKDEVIIDNPEVPNEIDETFEVDLIGFVTGENRDYVPNGEINVGGEIITTDEFGFFHLEKVLIGRKGKIINIQKEGYLPSIHRIANHQSLEQVILNLRMAEVSAPISISTSGGILEDENGMLTIKDNTVNTATDFIFQTFVGEDANTGNEDQLYLGSQPEFLLKEASMYFTGSSPLNSNSEIEVIISTDNFNSNDISSLSLFYFDESEQRWRQENMQLSKSGNDIKFSIDSYGWWTIAENVNATYATLQLTQLNDIKVNNAEVDLFYSSGEYSGSTRYTSSNGSISTYFPTDKSITTSLNNDQYKSDFTTGFNSGVGTGVINFNDELQVSFEAKVYDCDFTLSEGLVAVISQGQHKLLTIDEGVFRGETFSDDNDVTLRFYNTNFTYSNSKASAVETLQSESKSFFSCGDLDDKLVVTDGGNLLQDFDMCRVKERPNETVVIGERSNGDVFLVSFDGEQEGMYNGLFYFPEILDDVKSEVVVNIVLYDKVENKVGGFIKTEYISSGEELSISFIGNIE